MPAWIAACISSMHSIAVVGQRGGVTAGRNAELFAQEAREPAHAQVELAPAARARAVVEREGVGGGADAVCEGHGVGTILAGPFSRERRSAEVWGMTLRCLRLACLALGLARLRRCRHGRARLRGGGRTPAGWRSLDDEASGAAPLLPVRRRAPAGALRRVARRRARGAARGRRLREDGGAAAALARRGAAHAQGRGREERSGDRVRGTQRGPRVVLYLRRAGAAPARRPSAT